jgi:Arrestin (or S-antigen), C-terminal domain
VSSQRQKLVKLLTKLSAHSKRLSFSNRASTDQVKSRASPLTTANLNVFQRPISAFSRHRIRELSDIREVSGSSKDGNVRKKLSRLLDGTNERKVSKSTSQPTSPECAHVENNIEDTPPSRPPTPPHGLGSRATSALSLPMKDVPERRSSASIFAKGNATSRHSSVNDFPSWKLPPPSAGGQVIPPRGHASSPVREAMKHDAVSSDTLCLSPSKTFIRTTPPLEILDLSNIHHGRVDMNLQTPAPLFVGGGTIEGHLLLTIDGGGSARKSKPKPLSISRLSIDVVGVEEVTDGRRWIFLSLATELFDKQHPPPISLVTTQTPASGSSIYWPLQPASVVIPFCLNLPLNIGPPPYVSKQARIRYILCATAYIKPAGSLALVRQSFEIQMLTVYDPEKALSSLPTPLLATEQLSLPHGAARQNIKLTAGLHRQTWVNGAMIFVDVHVMNNSSKTLKKIEIQLEKTTLWYAHAAAGTTERSATHLRLPKRSDTEIVCASVIKKSRDWKGIPSRTSEVRTCDLEVPRGHITISTGRYFEVRYFLNVVVTVAMFKTIAVQLPVTIIHINSLDIVPNSLAQVAASIEAKRARTVPVADEALYPPFYQGQAFTAPRRQSLDRMRRASGGLTIKDLAALTRDLDDSPRRFAKASAQGHRHKTTMSTALTAENQHPGRLSMAPSSHHHHTRHNSCYHCHLQEADHAHHSRRRSSMSSLPGPKLPRLQLSTSGLGFSDSEFEIAPDSPPRKVMLSERERKLILQERELRLQRQVSRKNQSAQQLLHHQPSLSMTASGAVEKEKLTGPPGGHWGWRNVAVQPMATMAPRHAQETPGNQFPQAKAANAAAMETTRSTTRSRSNTGPSRFGMSGPLTSMTMSGQGQRKARGSFERGPRSGSGERVSGPAVTAGPGGGKGFRKSVEKW